MTILVTGANGQLGTEMRIISEGSSDRYIFSDISELPGVETISLDITDIEAIRETVKADNVDIIVNCAAYTNVDKAEDDMQLCSLLNSKAPENLATVMSETGGLLIHISTDYVFGGDPYNTPCREEQKGTPTGVYGETKLCGEQAVSEAGCDYVIIRTAWLYSEYGKNFVKTMLNLTSSRPELKVVFDQTGTPTYALDLANAISAVIDDYRSFLTKKRQSGTPDGGRYDKTGIYHFSDEGVCSWFDFSKMIAEYAGNTGCNILPCHSDEFPSKVTRPAYSVLDKTKIKETFGISVPYWTDSLKQCIANLRNRSSVI